MDKWVAANGEPMCIPAPPPPAPEPEGLDENAFHSIADEVIDLLSDEFSDIMDEHEDGDDYDVTFGDGVLAFSLGDAGTYVINKQTPNKQIWLSSPTSGQCVHSVPVPRCPVPRAQCPVSSVQCPVSSLPK